MLKMVLTLACGSPCELASCPFVIAHHLVNEVFLVGLDLWNWPLPKEPEFL